MVPEILGLHLGDQKYIVPLDENQIEPIRGRLEDPKNTPEGYPGWRWLQCTDYPGQFRILIPPRIASIYARLLDAEKWELSTYLVREDGRPNIVWERVAQLRALKNKMLRRCMRIADFRPYDPEISFQPLQMHAPATFTISSLEKWAKSIPFYNAGYNRGGSGSRTHNTTSRSGSYPPKRQQSSESRCNVNPNTNSGVNLTPEGGEIMLYDPVRSMDCHTSFKAITPDY